MTQQQRLQTLQDALAANGGLVRSGGPFDRWDLELRAGPLGGVKIRTTVEEHGGGKRMLKAKIWPRASAAAITVLTMLSAVSLYGWLQGRADIGIGVAVGALVGLALAIEGTGSAMRLALACVWKDHQWRDGISEHRAERTGRSTRRAEPPHLGIPQVTRSDPTMPMRRFLDTLQ